MAKELIGIMTLEKGERAVRTEDGKKFLVSNLFDGMAGKKVKVTVEEVIEEEEEEETEGQEEETDEEETKDASEEESQEKSEKTED